MSDATERWIKFGIVVALLAVMLAIGHIDVHIGWIVDAAPQAAP